MFIQPDWFEASDPAVGTNRYAYSHNDPINLADPEGNIPYNPGGSTSTGWTDHEDGRETYDSRTDRWSNDYAERSFGAGDVDGMHTVGVYDPVNYSSNEFGSRTQSLEVHSGNFDRSRSFRTEVYDILNIRGIAATENFPKGIGAGLMGLSRCIQSCSDGAAAIAAALDLYQSSPPHVRREIASYVRQQLRKGSPAYVAGRMVPGGVIGGVVGRFMVKKFGAEASMSLGILSALGEVGHRVNEARNVGLDVGVDFIAGVLSGRIR
ncbi:hypothetical protein NBRC116594_15050 [Shimia sp. NS0008-38b]